MSRKQIIKIFPEANCIYHLLLPWIHEWQNFSLVTQFTDVGQNTLQVCYDTVVRHKCRINLFHLLNEMLYSNVCDPYIPPNETILLRMHEGLLYLQITKNGTSKISWVFFLYFFISK